MLSLEVQVMQETLTGAGKNKNELIYYDSLLLQNYHCESIINAVQ